MGGETSSSEGERVWVLKEREGGGLLSSRRSK